MVQPTNNYVATNITSITPLANGSFAGQVFTAATPIQVPIDVTGNGNYLPDASPDLTAGTGNGRFENGWVQVGPAGGALSSTVYNLLGNGTNFIQSNAGIPINFLATDTSFVAETFGGVVTALTGTAFTVRIIAQDANPITWPNFVGGRLNVAGAEMTITAVVPATNTITVAAVGNIPLEVHDDDVNAVLPGAVDTTNVQASDDVTLNRFAQAYIRPVYDGGGSLANNRTDVPAILNTSYNNVYRWESRPNNGPSFWVSYLLAAFQPARALHTQDGDADAERVVWALANSHPFSTVPPVPGPGPGGVMFFMETIRDAGLPATWLPRLTVHEIRPQLRHSRSKHDVGR